MDAQLRREYAKFRGNAPFVMTGRNAEMALRSAKTLIEFRELEDQGLARLRAEQEEEGYFDAMGEPEGYTNAQGKWITPEAARKDIEETLERDGLWYVLTEYKEGCPVEDCECLFHRDAGRWEHADSIGMCAGYSDPCDPFENCYVIDLMQSAVDAVRLASSSPRGDSEPDRTEISRRLSVYYSERFDGKVSCEWDDDEQAYEISGHDLPSHPSCPYPTWTMRDHVSRSKAMIVAGKTDDELREMGRAKAAQTKAEADAIVEGPDHPWRKERERIARESEAAK